MKPIEMAEMRRYPPSTLYDLARNENARWEARKHAYLLLLDKGHPLAKHENLQQLAYMVADEVMSGKPEQAIANTEQPDPPLTSPEDAHMEQVSEDQAATFAEEQQSAGPFPAGFTTKNQLQDEVLPTIDIK